MDDAIRNLFIWLENALSVEVACAYPDLNFRTPYRHVELDSTAQKWGMEGNPEFDWREPRDSNCGLPAAALAMHSFLAECLPDLSMERRSIMSPMSPRLRPKALHNHHKTGYFSADELLRAFCMLPNGHSANLPDVIE